MECEKIITKSGSTKYLIKVKCPKCPNTRTVQDDRKPGNSSKYGNGEYLCKKCSMKPIASASVKARRNRMRYEDETLMSGTIVYWSKRRDNLVPVLCGGPCINKEERLIKFVRAHRNKINGHFCSSCAKIVLNRKGAKNKNWRGGRYNVSGYVVLNRNALTKEQTDIVEPMISKIDRILEHRLNMAMHVGRPLDRWEIVHHLNGDTTDNRVCNLQITTAAEHPKENSTMWDTLKAEIKRLQLLLESNNINYCK